MEYWQNELILQNRDKLILNTVCSTLFLNVFLSQGVFSPEDVLSLEAEVVFGSDCKAAEKFYDLIAIRKNAFPVLLEALKTTNQIVVLKILNQNTEILQSSHLTSQQNVPVTLEGTTEFDISIERINLLNIQYELNAKEQEISGILLQCLMISKIFEDETTSEHCKLGEVAVTPKLAIHHCIQLYEKIEKKTKIFSSRFDTLITSCRNLRSTGSFWKKIVPRSVFELKFSPKFKPLAEKDLINAHVHETVTLLYPKVAKTFKIDRFPGCLSSKQLADCGLAELKSSQIPHLVKRTLKGYVLAKLFMDSLNQKTKSTLQNASFDEIFRTKELHIIVSEDVLSSFDFPNYITCYFIDAMCERNPPPPKLGSKLLKNLKMLTGKHRIAKACAAGNFQNIFSFLFLQNNFNAIERSIIRELLFISAYHGSLSMLILCKNISRCMVRNLNDMVNGKNTLLHYAVHGGHYQTVKYLCENENFKFDQFCFENLVLYCIFNTKGLNEKLLEERVQILSLILNKNRQLIMCRTYIYGLLFRKKYVHEKILHALIPIILQDQILTRYFVKNVYKSGYSDELQEIILARISRGEYLHVPSDKINMLLGRDDSYIF